ncbi:MAG: AAA family ATPase [Pelagibacteraceae bacterium]|nr:AAA family ATPase [Pelagibacteraceae bacterium]
MLLNEKQRQFVELCYKEFGDIKEITRKQLIEVEKKHNVAFPQWLVADKTLKVKKGIYKIPSGSDTDVSKPTTMETVVKPTINKEAAYIVSTLTDNVVPAKDKNFVSFGNYPDVKSIIKSDRFYPVFLTGLSGNGKTMSVTQACADLKKELIRVNITIETDEDDLLGGFRLKDGHTVWANGPIIEAMERGAVLLLDEIDLASNKIMCLQPVLEGSGIFVKKINKWVQPKKGFNVIATANTKGQGSEDGKFIGTNVLNEAFLERFPVTFEQKYPSVATEKKILNNTLKSYGKSDAKFIDKLTTWADVIRKTYFDGGVDEIISTRRLVHITQAYSIFNNKMKAIQICTNRFDDDTKNSFVELYTKVDAGASADSIIEDQKKSDLNSQMEDNDSESDDEVDETDVI